MTDPQPWHRLFGLSWIDFFQGTAIGVETEMDLSIKKQLIDLVLIRKGLGSIPRPLPDGFEDLAPHNLVTFKSHQEALDCWALFELIGHFVNYRKQSSPSFQDLLPEIDYRLFAVCARFPQQLAQQATLTSPCEGVYELRVLTLTIRIIVVNQLPLKEQNAMLHLFSAKEDQLRYGREHFRLHSQETSSLLYKLFKAYSEEPDMSEKLQAFVRETIDELLASLPAEERLKGLPTAEIRKHLSPEERVEGLSAEERLKGLSLEDLAKALSPENREALARQLKANGSSAKPQ